MITATDLAPLPKLAKMHLSWPFNAIDPVTKGFVMFQADKRDLLTQYVRIAGSLPLSLEWCTPDQIQLAKSLNTPVNITSAPFARLRGTNPLAPAGYTGPEWWQDMGDFSTKLLALAPLSGQITHVMFDVEHWDKNVQNPADMIDKYTWLYKLTKGALPNATVFFYDCGSYTLNARSNTGWIDCDYCPSGTPGDVNNCSLYFSEHAINQQIYLKTKETSGGKQVIPCVSLGLCSQRERGFWGQWGKGAVPDQNVFGLGMELNHPWCKQFPIKYPLSDVQVIYFYPEPFTSAPNWGDQFINYVKGANNITT